MTWLTGIFSCRTCFCPLHAHDGFARCHVTMDVSNTAINSESTGLSETALYSSCTEAVEPPCFLWLRALPWYMQRRLRCRSPRTAREVLASALGLTIPIHGAMSGILIEDLQRHTHRRSRIASSSRTRSWKGRLSHMRLGARHASFAFRFCCSDINERLSVSSRKHDKVPPRFTMSYGKHAPAH